MKTITLALAILLFGFNSTTALSRIIKLNCHYDLSDLERDVLKKTKGKALAVIINTSRKKVCLQSASYCFPIIQNNDVSIIAAGAEWAEHYGDKCPAKFRKQTTITINKSDMSGSRRLNTRKGLDWNKSLNRLACHGNERKTYIWTWTCTRRLD